VDGCKQPDEIARLFADNYKRLFTSVPSVEDELDVISKQITEKLQANSATEHFVVTCDDVTVSRAIHKLNPGKRDDDVGLSSDFLIHACAELSIHLALLITAVMSHGNINDDLLRSAIVPIPKNKNVRESSIYRGITLSSIIGKNN